MRTFIFNRIAGWVGKADPACEFVPVRDGCGRRGASERVGRPTAGRFGKPAAQGAAARLGLLLMLLAAPSAPVSAQSFAATWYEFDGSEAIPIARYHRAEQRLRLEFEPPTTADESAASEAEALVLLGDRREAAGWLVSASGRQLGRQAWPTPLVMSWPLQALIASRCGDPAWRCQQTDNVESAEQTLSVWRLQHFEQGYWRQSLLWQDEQGGQVVREQWPNGRSVQLLESGTREHAGRRARFVHYVTTREDGTRWHSRYWYDAELDQVIREDLPDGRSYWLADFELQAQADELFVPPPAQAGLSAPFSAVLPPPPGRDSLPASRSDAPDFPQD